MRCIYDNFLSKNIKFIANFWDKNTINTIRNNKIISISKFNQLYNNRTLFSDIMRLIKMTRYAVIVSLLIQLFRKGLSKKTILNLTRTLLSIISFSSWRIITRIYLKILSKKSLTAFEFSLIGTLWNGTLCYYIDKKSNRKNLTTFSIVSLLS